MIFILFNVIRYTDIRHCELMAIIIRESIRVFARQIGIHDNRVIFVLLYSTGDICHSAVTVYVQRWNSVLFCANGGYNSDHWSRSNDDIRWSA